MFEMFAFVVIRVLAVIGFTLLPITLFNLWYHEELMYSEKRRLEWFRVAGSIVIGSIALSVMLAILA